MGDAPLTRHFQTFTHVVAAAVLWLALSPCDALAQLRLPVGGAVGAGSLGSIGVSPGIGSGIPGSQFGIGGVDKPVNDRLMLPLSVPLGPGPAGALTNPVTNTL